MPATNNPSPARIDRGVTGHSETGQEISFWTNEYVHFGSEPFK